MKKAILATKVGMTQIFAEDGTLVPVTVLEAGPNVVTQIKTADNDGYEAVQVGYVDAVDRAKNVSRDTLRRLVYPARSSSASSVLRTRQTISLALRSRRTSLQKVITSM